MTAPNAAYRHSFSSAGNVQNLTPGFLGRTPANIISAGTPYTAGQLTTISTDDLKRLDALAQAENRTMSQLAREAFGCLMASRRRTDEMQGAAVSVPPAAGGPKVLFHIGNAPGTGTGVEDTQETLWDGSAVIAATA